MLIPAAREVLCAFRKRTEDGELRDIRRDDGEEDAGAVGRCRDETCNGLFRDGTDVAHGKTGLGCIEGLVNVRDVRARQCSDCVACMIDIDDTVETFHSHSPACGKGKIARAVSTTDGTKRNTLTTSQLDDGSTVGDSGGCKHFGGSVDEGATPILELGFGRAGRNHDGLYQLLELSRGLLKEPSIYQR